MKRIYYSTALISILILWMSIASAAVVQDTVPANPGPGKKELSSQYFERAENQIIAGSILSGIGGASCVFSVWVLVVGAFTPKKRHTYLAGILRFGGLGMIAISVPLFIIGQSNRKKAKLIMKNESIMITPGSNTGRQLTTVGFAVRL